MNKKLICLLDLNKILKGRDFRKLSKEEQLEISGQIANMMLEKSSDRENLVQGNDKEKSGGVDMTETTEPKAHQIMGPLMPKEDKPNNPENISDQQNDYRNIDKQQKNKTLRQKRIDSLATIIGFLFRIFMMTFLFIGGIKLTILENEVTKTFEAYWLFRIMGVVLVFVSLYLLFNIFTKKVNKEAYNKWAVGFVATIIFLFIMFLDGDFKIRWLVDLISNVF